MQQSFFVVKSSDSVLEFDFTPDCTNDDGRREAAILHTITDLKFNRFVMYQYGSAAPVTNTMQRITILNEINREIPANSGNKAEYLEFSWNTSTHVITVEGKVGTPTSGPHDVDYSVCLFKGIDLLDDQPDTFVFIKAIDRDGNNTVVFNTIKDGQTKHYYDVSSDHP